MTDDRDDKPAQQDEQDEQDGQVSELAMGGGEPKPISSGDSVAGQPSDESGETQEGGTGPNAVPKDDTDEHPHRT